MNLRQLKRNLRALANDEKSLIAKRFFKTEPGQYGEGDQFLGIIVPELRKLARHYKTLPLQDVATLLASALHEERMIGLFIHRIQYEKTSDKTPLFEFYVNHRHGINNWDLVDTSTEYIVGDFLRDRDKSLLYDWAHSDNLWERRMAIMATFNFIKHHHFEDTLAIADILLNDPHDLIHKAVGWMLREIGNRDHSIEKAFLQPRYPRMPRTMLRYAIEKFPEPERRAYLNGTA